MISTWNRYLDSVLNIKISELHRENMKVDTKIQAPPEMKLSFEQTITIFGNLLENVKEACQNLPEKERWAKIRLIIAITRFLSGLKCIRQGSIMGK